VGEQHGEYPELLRFEAKATAHSCVRDRDLGETPSHTGDGRRLVGRW
jgi:hypothetical protein